jgi:hypothetical protein
MALVIFCHVAFSPFAKIHRSQKTYQNFQQPVFAKSRDVGVLLASTDFWFLSSCGPSRFEACRRVTSHKPPTDRYGHRLRHRTALLQPAMQLAPATTRAHGVIIVPEHGDSCELVAAHMDVSKRARLHANCEALPTRSF